LVEQAGLHTDKLVFGSLAEFRKIQFLFLGNGWYLAASIALGRERCAGLAETEWIKPPDAQRCGDL
jgi:hypothetical protein